MTAGGKSPAAGWRRLVNRPLVAVVSGLLVAALALSIRRGIAIAGWHFSNDFDQLWFAARALLSGADPYAAVLQAHDRLTYPLYYPLPAVLLVTPLAFLSLGAAQLVFAGACGFLMGFGLGRAGSHRFIALASVPFLATVLDGQMTAALTGAALVPALGFLLPAKPTVGLALWASWPSRRSALLAIGFTALSIAVWPPWPGAWLRAIEYAPHIQAPVLRPGGALLLLGALRWRQPEGRLLAVWACIPRTEAFYDLLPLFLITRSASETALLTVCSWLALLTTALLPRGDISPGVDLVAATATHWPVLCLLFYLPALVMVLSRRADALVVGSAGSPAGP